MRGSRRTANVQLHVKALEPGPDGEADTDDDRSPLDRIFADLGGEDRIMVCRKVEGAERYCCMLPVTEDLTDTLQQVIAERFGAGTYVLIPRRRNRTLPGYRTYIEIDELAARKPPLPAAQPDAAAAPAAPPVDLRLLMAEMRLMVQETVRAMLPAPASHSDKSTEILAHTVDMLRDLTVESMRAMRAPAPAPAPVATPGEDAERALFRMVTLAEKLGYERPNGGADRGGASDDPRRNIGERILEKLADKVGDRFADKIADGAVREVNSGSSSPAAGPTSPPGTTSPSNPQPAASAPGTLSTAKVYLPPGAKALSPEQLEAWRKRTATNTTPAPTARDAMPTEVER